jgi:tRNA dimethylallyltransferase
MVNNEHKHKIFCLMGPTAVGKTKLAIELIKHLPLEIISVDSGMIYQGMDIGTAKPTLDELKIAPHHLLSICDPKESYSAGKFRCDALQKIQEVFTAGRIPILVGGTMLYFWVLTHGISNLPKSNEKVRAKIKLEKEQHGLEFLYLRLQKIDPKTAARLHRTDSQRIQRALEVYELTGKNLSELQAISPPDVSPYEIVNIIITPKEAHFFHSSIVERFKEMLKSGFIDEVQKLYTRGDLHLDLPSMRAVGYRQVWQYLSGEISYERMLELVPIATRQLAKRQLTWLRKWSNARWFENNSPDLISKIVSLITF